MDADGTDSKAYVLALASEWAPQAMPCVALASRACLAASRAFEAPARFAALREAELCAGAVRAHAAAACVRAPARSAFEEALELYESAADAVERACTSALATLSRQDQDAGGVGGAEADDDANLERAREQSELFLAVALTPGVACTLLISEAQRVLETAAAVAASAHAAVCVRALRDAYARARALSDAAEPYEVAAACAAESWTAFRCLRAHSLWLARSEAGSRSLLDVPYATLARALTTRSRGGAGAEDAIGKAESEEREEREAAVVCAVRVRAPKVIALSTFDDRFCRARSTGDVSGPVAGVNALICKEETRGVGEGGPPSRVVLWLLPPPPFPRAFQAVEGLQAKQAKEVAAFVATSALVPAALHSFSLAAGRGCAVAPLPEVARRAASAREVLLFRN